MFSGIMKSQEHPFIQKDQDLSATFTNNVEFYEGRKNALKITVYLDKIYKNPENSSQYLVQLHTNENGENKIYSGTVQFLESFSVRNSPDEILNFGTFTLAYDSGNSLVTGKIRMQTDKTVRNNSTATITFKGQIKENNQTENIWFSNWSPDIDTLIFR